MIDRAAATRQPKLLSTLMGKYAIGESFLTAYLDYFERAQAVTLSSLSDIDALKETQKMWLYYALSTNQRGQDLMNEVKRYTALRDGRYLDIGCGFGGCLVAAARSGMTGTGLEVDTDRIDFAKHNISDHRLEEKARILHLDVLEPGVTEQIGQFDLISCNDVAEHVLDVQQLFLNLGKLLRPGGLAYVEIPNRYCIGSVASDGHFGLFGITLLERPEAMQYHWQVYRYTYDVGHYLTCPEYLDLFAQNGLSAQLVNSLYHATQEIGTYSEAIHQLDRRAEEFRSSQNVDADTKARVMDAYAAYLEKLRSDYLAASRQPAAQQIGFRNTYLRPFWTFVAKRV